MINIAFVLIAGVLIIMLYATHRGRPVEFHAWGMHFDTKHQRMQQHENTAGLSQKPGLWIALGVVVASVLQWLVGF